MERMPRNPNTPRPVTLAQAQTQYPHRFTGEHVPQWALIPDDDGRFYAPQYRNDAEWYENTTFPGEGGLSPAMRECRSFHPTWPLGRWLTAPHRPALL